MPHYIHVVQGKLIQYFVISDTAQNFEWWLKEIPHNMHAQGVLFFLTTHKLPTIGQFHTFIFYLITWVANCELVKILL